MDTQVQESSQIIGIEGVYDLLRWLSISQKFGYKFGATRPGNTSDWVQLGTFLTVSRLNFHVTRKWDIAAEYRIRFDNQDVSTIDSGILFEIDREILDYVRFGIGYNFTNFDDDLRKSNSYKNHGFFSRVSGKF